MEIKVIKGIIDSNTFVLTKDDTTIVIDAGAKYNGKADAVLITHEHYDHNTHADGYACPVYRHPFPPALTIGDFEIQCIHAPGHSPCSTLFLIDDHLFTGDVLFRGTIGRMDLPGGCEKQMAESLRKLLDVKFTIAHHGHGPDTTYEEQQANIKRQLSYLED